MVTGGDSNRTSSSGSLGLLGPSGSWEIPNFWVANALAQHGSNRLGWASNPPQDVLARSGFAIELWEVCGRKSRFAEDEQVSR